jgi:glycosyltransferase involved in cell wall biosynthesis
MTRVLVVAREYEGTGAGEMAGALARHWLGACGWKVDLHRSPAARPVPAALTDAGAGVVDGIALRDYGLAVVVGLGSTDTLRSVAVKVAPHLPCLLWVHEDDAPLWSADLKPLDWLRLFRAFAAIVVQTAWQRDTAFGSFLARVPPARISIVPNGLPPCTDSPRATVRPPAGRRRVAFVGGVYPRKRPQDLVRAIELLGLPDVECAFIGTTAHLESCAPGLRQLLQAQPERFRLLGEMPRAAALAHVAGADALCLPSASESQPLALLEAAALGVPICASDLPPYAGIWRHGHDCLLHPVGAIGTLARNLRLALDNDTVRRSLAHAARDTALRFDFARFATEFTRAAEAAMRTHRRR